MLDSNLYDPLGTYISCWMSILVFSTNNQQVIIFFASTKKNDK